MTLLLQNTKLYEKVALMDLGYLKTAEDIQREKEEEEREKKEEEERQRKKKEDKEGCSDDSCSDSCSSDDEEGAVCKQIGKCRFDVVFIVNVAVI